MAHQIKNVFKSSSILAAPSRGLSSIFSGSTEQSNTLNSSKLHLAVQREYPQAQLLPIPPNVDVAETSRFSPLRNRDITASAIAVQDHIDITLDQTKADLASSMTYEDPHVSLYDAHSPLSTGAVMQSTVPEPYGGNRKFTNLNMPGGSWGLQTKYLSHELNSSHYTQLRQDIRRQEKGEKESPKAPSGESDKTENSKVSGQSKLKTAVKEYGSTVIVFHVAISLASLATSYVLVSSGLDVVWLLEKVNLADKFKFAENASTFVIAYALHKVFAPVRISITLASVPFIVRFLRKKGILKAK